VTVLPVTTEIRPIDIFRIVIESNERNGLREPSQIMVDKAHTIPHDKADEAFGVLEARTLAAVNRSLVSFWGWVEDLCFLPEVIIKKIGAIHGKQAKKGLRRITSLRRRL